MAKTAKPQEDEGGFYAKHKKVYPREVHGVFASLRVIGVTVLLGFYYFIPLLYWEGRQAVLFDLPNRRFYIFDWTFWPQDFFYLALLLIIAALALFFFTALAGRLWCGYACPQTVWTEVFLWIERKIEGDRNKQIKLDNAPLTKFKIQRKALKHFIWIAFSAWTGFTFVAYFTPMDQLAINLINFDLGPWEWFWIIFYSFATYGNSGWMREQVCIYMCPYARFQSAMFDKNTLVISYDQTRGEPRGARKKSVDPKEAGLGHCVDCTLCVQVCPTGIDIRDGLQYQCIGCAACVDVCNEVMDKMKYPRDLVQYTTQNAIDGIKTRILRPRIILYSVLLLALFSGLIYGMANRIPLELDIIRDRNALYKTTSLGYIENVYTLKIANKDTVDHIYTLTLDTPFESKFVIRNNEITVKASKTANVSASIIADPTVLKSLSTEIQITLETTDDPKQATTEAAVFLGPRKR